ncbi:MAG TPA: tetratricopeptide repeat protein [Terriglobales bacterium]|jgi:Flp pilus assembly protein TadD|nr:tetratricopeptide repeat protein [Terriglobales bacterium]
MAWKRWLIIFCVGAVWGLPMAHAGDLKIYLPKRSKLTPVQRLNREGVEALRKNNLEKAKSQFYRAYLFDPDDPFTLNNMGYISELEGQAEQARNFYTLAARLGTDAVVDKASSPHMEGQTFLSALSNAHDVPMEVNRSNVAAVRLLSEGRAPEAEQVLRHALNLDQKNPFTLNNLGVTKEAEGDFEGALKYYSAAADLHSEERVIVSQSGAWRGKPISEMAAETVKRLSQRMQNVAGPEEQAGLLNLHGVAALNRNDRQAAGKAFLQAYQLDPNSAFTLNNLGYLAEMDGDLETAQVFYEKARMAQNAKDRVGLATRQSAEGLKLFQVAEDSNQSVGVKIGEQSAARRRETGPIELKRRDGKPVDEPSTPDATQPAIPPN